MAKRKLTKKQLAALKRGREKLKKCGRKKTKKSTTSGNLSAKKVVTKIKKLISKIK